MLEITIRDRVRALITQHGGLLEASRALKIDKAYLRRLGTGAKTNPSTAMLARLGLRRVTTIVSLGEEKS
jgi:hypothetical protein